MEYKIFDSQRKTKQIYIYIYIYLYIRETKNEQLTPNSQKQIIIDFKIILICNR